MPGWQILKAEILVVQKNMWFDPGGEIPRKVMNPQSLGLSGFQGPPQQAATHKARLYELFDLFLTL